jgi:hypothetical protein
MIHDPHDGTYFIAGVAGFGLANVGHHHIFVTVL